MIEDIHTIYHDRENLNLIPSNINSDLIRLISVYIFFFFRKDYIKNSQYCDDIASLIALENMEWKYNRV